MNKDQATMGKSPKAPAGAQTGPQGAFAEGLTSWERDQIKHRAYALWWEAGRPQGQDRELWEQAELQVLKARGAHG